MNIQENIEEALAFISSDLPRDEWLKVATAIKSCLGDAGFSIFNSWSKSSKKYNPKAVKSVWMSVRLNSRVSAGTIFYFAKQNGFQFKKMSYSERKSFNLEIITMKKKSEEYEFLEAIEQKKVHQRVAIKAKHIWECAGAVDNDAGYLKRKRIGKYIVANEGIKQNGTQLIIPLFDVESNLINIQTIKPNGDKLFLSGGKVKGCFSIIGKIKENIYICEGYATGRTLHQLTNEATFCAMYADNLKPVALEVRKKYPSTKIIIACDNDRLTNGNPGLTKGKEAAFSVKGEYIYPRFKDFQKGTDFNDLAILAGDI